MDESAILDNLSRDTAHWTWKPDPSRVNIPIRWQGRTRRLRSVVAELYGLPINKDCWCLNPHPHTLPPTAAPTAPLSPWAECWHLRPLEESNVSLRRYCARTCERCNAAPRHVSPHIWHQVRKAGGHWWYMKATSETLPLAYHEITGMDPSKVTFHPCKATPYCINPIHTVDMEDRPRS